MVPLHAGLSLAQVLMLMRCPACGRNDPRCGEHIEYVSGVDARVCAWVVESLIIQPPPGYEIAAPPVVRA